MDITAVSRLAKLRLTSEEEKKLGSQLENILKQFESLSELETAKPTENGLEKATNLRGDVVRTYPVEQQNALLSSSPHKRENFIKLPPVL